jgi:DNA-binding NarL/FixJ family response regulator
VISVGIVDDEPLIRSGIRGVLETAEDIHVVAEASTGTSALQLVEHQIDEEASLVAIGNIHGQGEILLAHLERTGSPC